MPKKFFGFETTFWTANGVELFERAAYYGTFIALVIFLTNVVGYSDIESGWIGGVFSALIYFLPLFTGAIADKIGFRASLIIAFSLLSIGYFGLGFFPLKMTVLFFLVFIALGGSFVKPVITGTVAKSSSEDLRAKAYSLFYMTVNIGSFTGKSIAKPLRTSLGVDFIPYYSSALAFIALVIVFFLYFPKKDALMREQKRIKEIFLGMVKAFKNIPFLMLIIITGAFWAIQHQLYATLPKYVIRLVGEGASPEWYANVNPLVVVFLVVPITHFAKKVKPITSISISFLLLTVSSFTMSLSSLFKAPISIVGYQVHPITLMMVIGIAIQGVAECFLSPRYLEFASLQASKGEEGLYMGYAHLNTTVASILAFASSGYLLDRYCPDPKKFADLDPTQFALLYSNAHYIWYFYSGLALSAFILLLLLNKSVFSKKN
ncbi:MAG: MFS transporter [Acidobacteria bacterium]|nr:MFS transporter [Acidobacteriota bacterium]